MMYGCGDEKTYLFEGAHIVASDFGNINAGYTAAALGLPKGLLDWQAGAAQSKDHEYANLSGFASTIASQIDSLAKGASGRYGDEEDDYNNVAYGYDAYMNGHW